MIGVTNVDGSGGRERASVSDKALHVHPVGYPPYEKQKTEVFSQKLTDDGLTSGSDDMGIDGSSTATEFWVPADDEDDIYINRLSVIVGYGASAPLYDFVDSGSALTNGVLIDYVNAFGNKITIGNPTRNYSFLRLSLTDGIIPTAWELRNLGALNDYGFFISLDLSKLVPPYGIQLLHGTNAKIMATIRDDCTDADTFNMKVFGFKRLRG